LHHVPIMTRVTLEINVNLVPKAILPVVQLVLVNGS
jgi:hypothetical protein